MVALSESDVAFLREPRIAVLSTVMPDGAPHSTPVWVDTDGEHVLFNILTSSHG